MRISLKHEAMRAGNVSVTDIYNCSEVELRTMVERDRCLRAIRMGCSPRDIALRTPQTILQELWNAEERSAHAYYRSDRVSGVICSYEDLVGAGREPQGCSASSEDILLCAEDARERANCLQAIFAEIEKLPAGQRNIVRGVLVKGASQSDTENMRTDRCDNTQCDGSRCKGNTMFRLELDTENRRVHRRRHAR